MRIVMMVAVTIWLVTLGAHLYYILNLPNRALIFISKMFMFDRVRNELLTKRASFKAPAFMLLNFISYRVQNNITSSIWVDAANFKSS